MECKDGAYWYRCSVICLSVGHNCEPYKKAEPIEVSFRVWTGISPRKHVLDGARIPPGEGAISGVPLRCVISSKFFAYMLIISE